MLSNNGIVFFQDGSYLTINLMAVDTNIWNGKRGSVSSLNGKIIHRNGAPAIIWETNQFLDKYCYLKDGKYHRLDGPAVCNDYKYYHKLFYLNGINYNNLDFAKETNHLICHVCCEFCNQDCF